MRTKYILPFLWIALLVSAKFFFYYQDYDKYYHVVSMVTFVLYISISLFITAFLIRRKKVMVANIFVLGMLLIALEFMSYILLRMPKKVWKGYPVSDLPHSHKGYYLGNVPWADSVMHDMPEYEGITFADVRYSIDSLNRRITPGYDINKARYLLFFGCSVCFGYGLNDRETIPYLVQQKTREYNAYNYAYNGWGPHHMLALLENENIRAEVKGNDGLAVYVFLWSHIRRAICDFQIYTSWGHTMPCFKLEGGIPVYRGNFKEGRPLVSGIYEELEKFYTLKIFNFNFPISTSDEDYTLVAEMIERARELYQWQFGNDHFVVVIYPDISLDFEGEKINELLIKLKDRNIRYLDYSNLKYMIRGNHILMDGHPNLKSNDEFSSMLVKDLGLN